MLCRPGPGRENAVFAVTSARAARMSAPCQAPGPYPSSTMRAVTVASGIADIVVLTLDAVLIGSLEETWGRLCSPPW
jgi:hypothetical protein